LIDNSDFPALFRSSDELSNRKQSFYLWLLKGQFIGLVAAAVCLGYFENSRGYGYAYLFFVAFSLAMLIWLISSKPEKDWYRFRALAESVKTRTWLFIMGAEPFDISKGDKEVRLEFAEDLTEILKSNQFARSKLIAAPSENITVSDKMMDIRSLGLSERKSFYLKNRIDDQCTWYRKKSKFNNRRFVIWSVIAVLLYLFAFALIVHGLSNYEEIGLFLSPSIFLVAASAVVGWMQIKKFNELAAAYALTAHEITLAKEKFETLVSEEQFAETVDEIELVFSREHTQWVARQQS